MDVIDDPLLISAEEEEECFLEILPPAKRPKVEDASTCTADDKMASSCAASGSSGGGSRSSSPISGEIYETRDSPPPDRQPPTTADQATMTDVPADTFKMDTTKCFPLTTRVKRRSRIARILRARSKWPKRAANGYRLPHEFSLTSKLYVDEDITARELVELCQLRGTDRFKPIFDENPQFPSLPENDTSPYTSVLELEVAVLVPETLEDAHSDRFRDACLSHPICLIRGLTELVGVDINVFTSERLAQLQPERKIELRKQPMPRVFSKGGRRKATWHFNSERSYRSIASYADYQSRALSERTQIMPAEVCRDSEDNNSNDIKREENSASPELSFPMEETKPLTTRKRTSGTRFTSPKKEIEFATNLDITDPPYTDQFAELTKLPQFLRIKNETDILRYVGYSIKGLNTPQVYLKVAGSRTPAHQENLMLASVNVNIGPGDCEWFGVDERHWGEVARMCDERDLSYLADSWWPVVEHLHERGIPVYRFAQRPGDIVLVNIGCVHWVQALGACNNVSYNVGPLSRRQLTASLERSEFNRTEFFESILRMADACWRVAECEAPIPDKEVRRLVRGVMVRSLAQLHFNVELARRLGVRAFFEDHEAAIADAGFSEDERPTPHVCNTCFDELFGAVWAHDSESYCERCVDKTDLESVNLVISYHLDDLARILDAFQI